MVKRTNRINPGLLTADFARFGALSADERRAVFTATADELGASVQAIEKDFHVCRVIDALFRAAPTQPKLFFKGGTSLSKGYGLIGRFSEDIDLVLSRPGLGISKSADPTHTKFASDARKSAVAAIMGKCSSYASGPMMKQLQSLLPNDAITLDSSDEDGATLLVQYASLFPPYEYLKQQVKVECGARGAAEPCQLRPITPYIQSQLPKDKWSLTTKNVTLIRPERTCWEKISILHMAHCRLAHQGKPPGDKQYASRHYYDVAMLHEGGVVARAIATPELLDDVKRNLHLMWRKNQTYLGLATPGTLRIAVPSSARSTLEADYAGMAGMMFTDPPSFSWVVEQLAEVDDVVNAIAAEMKASA
jgi:hypothetical protein